MPTNKTILITGATSGFGEAIARLVAKQWQNPTLLLTGRREERLKTLKQELSQQNVKVETFCFDIRDRKAVEKFAMDNKKILESVDMLVNNAGLASGLTPIQSGEIDDWEAMIDTNIKGLLYMTRAILPQMVARKSGHVVNIGSVAGHTTYPNGNVYSATKHAVRALNESMRLDVHGSGVRVTSIDPGMAETEFSKVRFHGDEARAGAVYKGMKPLSAHDIAEAVLWSLERPAHVNIQEIVLLPTDQASARDVHRRN